MVGGGRIADDGVQRQEAGGGRQVGVVSNHDGSGVRKADSGGQWDL